MWVQLRKKTGCQNWTVPLKNMKHLPELRTLNVTIKTKHVLNFLHAFCIEVLKGIENKNRKYTLVEYAKRWVTLFNLFLSDSISSSPDISFISLGHPRQVQSLWFFCWNYPLFFHRWRIKTEEKAKVVAAVWGTYSYIIYSTPCRARYFEE